MFNHCTTISRVMLRLFLLMMVIILFVFPIRAVAQGSTKNADKLSQELVNPIGPNWLINTYLNVMEKKGDITDDSHTGVEWLIQPVMPIPVNKKTGLILMNRPALPIYFRDPVPRKNAMGDMSGFSYHSGIGDLTVQTALGKMAHTDFGSLMWGIGSVLIFPTASEDSLGSEKYSAGPVVMMVGFTKKYSLGAMLDQVWSYAGNNNRDNISRTQFQIFYYLQLGHGWQLGDNPTWTFKSNADSGEQYDIPVGLGIFKTTYIFGTPWRFGITPRYNLKSYDSWGNNWGISFTITPVIKNPFM